MIAVVGTYQNGYVTLDKEYVSKTPVKVIITFLEEVEATSEKRLTLNDFSYSKSQKDMEGYKGSFSETLIEERRNEL